MGDVRTPAVSIRYLSYRREEYVRETLPRLAMSVGCQFPIEFIIHDNNGDRRLDGFYRDVEEAQKRSLSNVVSFGIWYYKNRGYAAATNIFWRGTYAPLICSIDNDIEVKTEDWVSKLVWAIHADERVAVVGGFTDSWDETAARKSLDQLPLILGQGSVGVRSREYIDGNYIARRSVIDKYGELDESDGFFQGWTSYQSRLTRAGLIVGYSDPPVLMAHLESPYHPKHREYPEYTEWKNQVRGTRHESVS